MISNSLQRIYITILNPVFEKYLSKMDNRLREAYLRFVFICIQCYFLLYFSKAFKKILFSYSQRELFGALLIMLAAIFSMQGTLQPVKWKKRIFVPLLLGAAGIIVTGLMHPIGSGYLVFGFELLLIYPCFYFVWNNRKDYETLFDIAAETNAGIGAAYFIYCIAIYRSEMFVPNGERFQGSIRDANLYSIYGMAIVCSAMYMIYRKRNSKKWSLLYSVSAAMGFVIVVLGQSRSALLTAVAAMLITCIFGLKNRSGYRRDISKTVAKLLVICLAATLCMSAVTDIARAYGDDSADVYTEIAEEAAEDDSIFDRLSPVGKDLNTFTSGRAEIWPNYAEKLNMTGNDFSKIDWTEMTGNTVKHAHNNFLEFGYRCGIPVSAMFILLELFAGLLSLKYLFSKKWRREGYLYAVIFMFVYTGMSMIDIATISMERYAPFAFYIILTVMIDANENEHSVK